MGHQEQPCRRNLAGLYFVNLFTHHRSISNKISIKVDFVSEMFCGINFYVYFCIKFIMKIWKEIY